jgi:hypothetical protein
VKTQSPYIELEEAKPSGCTFCFLFLVPGLPVRVRCPLLGVQAGGIFVNTELKRHLTALFAKNGISEQNANEWISVALEDFEKKLKPSYPSPGSHYSVLVSSSKSCKNQSVGIRLGRLYLSE